MPLSVISSKNKKQQYTIADYIRDKATGGALPTVDKFTGRVGGSTRTPVVMQGGALRPLVQMPTLDEVIGSTGTSTSTSTGTGTVGSTSTAVGGASGKPLLDQMLDPNASNALAPDTEVTPSLGTTKPTVDEAPPNTNTSADTGKGMTPEEVEKEVNSILTTDHVNNRVNEVLTELLGFSNRKFQYNAKESPLYTILQQQAAKEARIASGRAYSRAVANAGGFGTSYANLAAEEASRQVMAGLDDQQLALYQAAKDEWDSQWSSKIDEYNFLKSVQEDLSGDETSTDDVFLNAVSAMRERYGSEYNEAAMRADLQAMGLSEEQITSVLANQKQYSEAMKTPTDSTAPSMGASDAFNYILSLGENGWNGSNEAQIRAILNAQATAGGWTSEDVEAAIEMLKDIDMAQEEDSFKMFQRNPTLSGAVQIMAEAKENGNTGAAFQQVTRIMYTEFAKAMKDLENAYSFIGVNKTEWESMDDGAREEAILATGMEAVSSGIMSKDAFGEIVKLSLDRNVNDVINGNKADRTKLALILDELYGAIVLKENGYITEEKLNGLISWLRSFDFIKNELKNNDRSFSGSRLEAYELLKGESEYRDAAGRTLNDTGEYLRDKVLATSREKIENDDENHRGGR